MRPFILTLILLPALLQAYTITDQINACKSDANPAVCVGLVLYSAIKPLQPPSTNSGAGYCRCAQSNMGTAGKLSDLERICPGQLPEKIGSEIPVDRCVEAMRYPPCTSPCT